MAEPKLQRYLLHYQTKLDILCCFNCKVLLTSQTGLSHVCNCHAECYELYPEAKFSEICSRLGIWETYTLIKELKGLEAISRLYMHTMALFYVHDDCGMLFFYQRIDVEALQYCTWYKGEWPTKGMEHHFRSAVGSQLPPNLLLSQGPTSQH